MGERRVRVVAERILEGRASALQVSGRRQQISKLVAIPGQFGPFELFFNGRRHGRSRRLDGRGRVAVDEGEVAAPDACGRRIRHERQLLVCTSGFVHVTERERGVTERGERRRVGRGVSYDGPCCRACLVELVERDEHGSAVAPGQPVVRVGRNRCVQRLVRRDVSGYVARRAGQIDLRRGPARAADEIARVRACALGPEGDVRADPLEIDGSCGWCVREHLVIDRCLAEAVRRVWRWRSIRRDAARRPGCRRQRRSPARERRRERGRRVGWSGWSMRTSD